jgi:rhodanese-related sulfurtransferase
MRTLAIAIILELIWLAACQTPPSKTSDAPEMNIPTGVSEMSPLEAYRGTQAAYSQFIDVRTPGEYRAGHADRARNIPLDTIGDDLAKLESNEPVFIICRTDNRSRQAAAMLVDAGFPKAVVVTGGTEAWKAAGLPMVDHVSRP